MGTGQWLVHGLYCRLVGRADTPPTVDQLYEYFELTNGSDYMQTIDSVKEADLRPGGSLFSIVL